MRVQRVLQASVAALLVGVLAACEPVPVVTFVVDSTVDAVDAVPGDGVCGTATGACTLRAAIQEANALEERVVIDLAPMATYTLTLAGRDEDAGATGDLDVSAGNLTIHGNDAKVTAGRAWQTNPMPNAPPGYFAGGVDRVLDHRAGALTVDDLIITGGYVDRSGAGIRSAASLALIRVQVVGNETYGTTPGGIGIHQVGGSLFLQAARVSANRQVGEDPGPAGGLLQAGGTTVVLDSIFQGNSSEIAMGVYHPNLGGYLNDGDFAGYRQTGGTATIINTLVSDQHWTQPQCSYSPTQPPDCSGQIDYFGDGVRADGQMEIVSSQLVRNNDPDYGTVDLAGTATVRGSIVETCASGAMTSLGYNRVGSGCPVGSTDRTEGPDVDQIPVGAPGLCDGSIATDRFGVARPQGGACDIGDEEH